jgi:hypothetical protein
VLVDKYAAWLECGSNEIVVVPPIRIRDVACCQVGKKGGESLVAGR